MKRISILLFATFASLILTAEIRKGCIASFSIQHSSSKESISAKPYIQNGLVAWYDGEWNAQIGEHDSSATVWKDLSENGNDLQVSVGHNCYWEDKCLRTDSYRHNNIYAVGSRGIQYDTCEWIIEQIELPGLVSFSGMGDYRFFEKDTNSVQFFAPYTETTIDGTIPYKGCFQCVYLGGSTLNAFANGDPLYRRTQQSSWQYASQKQNFGIGGGSRYYQWQMCGRVFCVRLYNRKLSERELAHNLAIDKVRFGL